jgi:hypothetical protein
MYTTPSRVCALALFSVMIGWVASAQPNSAAPAKLGTHWRLLAGKWNGESSAGGSTGTCSFLFALGDHVMMRTNHADLAAGNRPAGVHDDLMVIYPGSTELQAQAIYWDNEGHTIDYAATWSTDGSTLTLLSKPSNGPQFRLIYKKLDPDSFSVSFDVAPPGQTGAFKTYTSGRILRHK